jgi:DNA polymerase-3 subunit delta
MAKSQVDLPEQFHQFSLAIKSGDFKPLYLLQGEETWFVEELTQQLENSILPEAERSFNQMVLYGRDVKPFDLMGMARRYPMMSKYQVIILKEAQDMKEWDVMLPYLESPSPSTILVIAWKGGKMDSRTKAYKAIAKHAVFTADKLRDYQLKKWIPEYCKRKGKSIDQQAADLLVDLLGTDLPAIINELDKIIITLKDDFIRNHHVETQVGFNREYNVFELQNALGLRDFNRSIQIAHQMAARSEKGDIMRITPVLFNFFSKILQLYYLKGKSDDEMAKILGVNFYFFKDYKVAASRYKPAEVERAIGYLKYMDLRLKGVNRGAAEDGDLLVETVLQILKN